MRLIDANALKKAINTEFKGHLLYFPIAFKDLIDNAPTVEPVKPYIWKGKPHHEFVEILKRLVNTCSFDSDERNAVLFAIEVLSGRISIKPERPQGEWSLDNRPNIGGLWKCSKFNTHYPYKTKFCPNCGADMRGDNNG